MVVPMKLKVLDLSQNFFSTSVEDFCEFLFHLFY
jgi:hypothetical protein